MTMRNKLGSFDVKSCIVGRTGLAILGIMAIMPFVVMRFRHSHPADFLPNARNDIERDFNGFNEFNGHYENAGHWLMRGRVLEELLKRVLTSRKIHVGSGMNPNQSSTESRLVVLAGQGAAEISDRMGATCVRLKAEEVRSWADGRQGLGGTHTRIHLLVVDGGKAAGEEAILSSTSSILGSQAGTRFVVLRVRPKTQPASLEPLFNSGYKLQVLSATHSIKGLGPNTQLDRSSALSLLPLLDSEKAHLLVFASQELQLAIPSRSYLLSPTSLGCTQLEFDMGMQCHDFIRSPPASLRSCKQGGKLEWSEGGHVIGRCPDGSIRPVLKSWMAGASSNASYEQEDEGQRHALENGKGERHPSFGDQSRHLHLPKPLALGAEEVACGLVQCDARQGHDTPSCITKIGDPSVDDHPSTIPGRPSLPLISMTEGGDESGMRNILVVILHGCSRRDMLQWLPRTTRMLDQVGYDSSFGNTRPMDQGRGQGSLEGATELGARVTRLLRKRGYVTYHSTNGCISGWGGGEGHHGGGLSRATCQHGRDGDGLSLWAQPNCVGGMAASGLVLEHAQSFVDKYDGILDMVAWGSVVELVDGEEDSRTLIRGVDSHLEALLNKVHQLADFQSRSSVVVMGMSQAGLLRTIGLSEDLNGQHKSAQMESLTAELRGLISSVLFLNAKPLPAPPRGCERLLIPPSPFSFFSDIPRGHRARLNSTPLPTEVSYHTRQCPLHISSSNLSAPPHSPGNYEVSFAAEEGDLVKCRYATTTRAWADCDDLVRSGKNIHLSDGDDFALVEMGGTVGKVDIHINIVRRKVVIERWRALKADKSLPPNILIIEIDSVSQAYAERHLPKTLKALKTIEESTWGRGKKFRRFAVEGMTITGAASLANQLSLLAGCIPTAPDDWKEAARLKDAGMVKAGSSFRTDVYCPGAFSAKGAKTLFSAARKSGYVTWFGEEFCSVGSPWVPQGQFWDRDAVFDHSFDLLYCRLLIDRYKESESIWPSSQDPWSNTPPTCLSGSVRHSLPFKAINMLWSTYTDVPKFAFVNLMPAHNYSPKWDEQPLDVEASDSHIAANLLRLMRGEGGNNTVLLVRGDHGIQQGPLTADYSIQTEHSSPWTELIIPNWLSPHLGKATPLEDNSKAPLITPLDLHKTLLRLIDQDSHEALEEPYAYDLLKDRVSIHRTCSQALIPDDLCPCYGWGMQMGGIESKKDGICNFLTPNRAFCT